MVHKRKTKVRTRIGWIVPPIALVSVAFALFLLPPTNPEATIWRTAPGTVLGVKVMVDNVLQTKWGSEVRWKAEYRVAYEVKGHEYIAWADAGIREESERDVRLHLPRTHPECRVRYKLESPAVSFADCR